MRWLQMWPNRRTCLVLPGQGRGAGSDLTTADRTPDCHPGSSAARKASEMGDDGTNDLLAGDVLRTNEMQVWFLSEHLVDVPTVRAD